MSETSCLKVFRAVISALDLAKLEWTSIILNRYNIEIYHVIDKTVEEIFTGIFLI